MNETESVESAGSDVSTEATGECATNTQANDRMLSYRFLASAYRTAPDADYLELLKTIEPFEGYPLADFLDELAASDDIEHMRVDLAAEFARLFLNMGPNPVPPYESVYTSEQRLLMQDARDEVLAAYQAERLELAADFKVPEDHLSIEFDFMAHLCEKEAAAHQTSDAKLVAEYAAKQRVFLDEHLQVWVPSFCEDMTTRAKTSYYQGICAMTLELIETDRALLA